MFSEKSKLYLSAIASLLAATFFLFQAITFEKSYPKYNDLLFSEGELVGRAYGSRHAFRFSLSDSDGKFQYHSASGKMITVKNLVNAGTVAKVGYTIDGSGRKSVYELEIDGRKVGTYEDIKAANKSGNKWSFLLAPFLIFGAIFCFRIARRH